MKNQPPWECHAHPAALGGKPCGHLNATGGIGYQGQVCCAACGATKHASDDRLARKKARGIP